VGHRQRKIIPAKILKVECKSNTILSENTAQLSVDWKSSTMVELKTSKLLTDQRVTKTFARYKAHKYWIQSYLGGVEKIIVGFRDDSGQVTQLSQYETKRLPALGAAYWSDRKCIRFLHQLLKELKQTLVTGMINKSGKGEEDVNSDNIYTLSYTQQKLRLVQRVKTNQEQALLDTFRNKIEQLRVQQKQTAKEEKVDTYEMECL